MNENPLENVPTAPVEPERVPIPYTREDLEKDILEWIKSPAVGDERRREEMSHYSFLRQFINYQNNFYILLTWVSKYLDKDGNLKQEYTTTQDDRIFYERVIGYSHSVELFNIAKELGYNSKEFTDFSTPITDDQIEIIMRFWIEMRRRGYSRMELIS